MRASRTLSKSPPTRGRWSAAGAEPDSRRGGTGRSLRTCTGLICTCEARHCTLRLLQQPEQRCTSTQGGHTRKLALVRSMRFREIWNTSVRVLHSAITAGSAAAREPEGGATKEAVRRGRSSLEPTPILTALNLGRWLDNPEPQFTSSDNEDNDIYPQEAWSGSGQIIPCDLVNV